MMLRNGLSGGYRREEFDLRVCRNIFLGDRLTDKRRVLLWKIKHNMPLKGIYVLVLPEVVPENLMEIYVYEELRRRKQYDRFVIGAASDRQDAIEQARRIVEGVYRTTGAFDVRSYVCRTEIKQEV